MLREDGMWNHGYELYPELVHVPLVISGDGVADAQHEGNVIPSTYTKLLQIL